jgi:hypothetical protein
MGFKGKCELHKNLIKIVFKIHCNFNGHSIICVLHHTRKKLSKCCVVWQDMRKRNKLNVRYLLWHRGDMCVFLFISCARDTSTLSLPWVTMSCARDKCCARDTLSWQRVFLRRAHEKIELLAPVTMSWQLDN